MGEENEGRMEGRMDYKIIRCEPAVAQMEAEMNAAAIDGYTYSDTIDRGTRVLIIMERWIALEQPDEPEQGVDDDGETDTG